MTKEVHLSTKGNPWLILVEIVKRCLPSLLAYCSPEDRVKIAAFNAFRLWLLGLDFW